MNRIKLTKKLKSACLLIITGSIILLSGCGKSGASSSNNDWLGKWSGDLKIDISDNSSTSTSYGF